MMCSSNQTNLFERRNAARMRFLSLFCTLIFAGCGSIAPNNVALNPLVDYRATGQVPRNANGTTKRSPQVLAAFRQAYPCPATKKTNGACLGWAIDHVIPLACGGADAVFNLQWLPLRPVIPIFSS